MRAGPLCPLSVWEGLEAPNERTVWPKAPGEQAWRPGEGAEEFQRTQAGAGLTHAWMAGWGFGEPQVRLCAHSEWDY